MPHMFEDCGNLTCAATGRQSIEHQTLRRRLPRRGKTLSIYCQATCRKQLRSSASRLLRPTIIIIVCHLYEVECNDKLKGTLYNSSPLTFFSEIALLSRNFPKCIAHIQRIVAMFGGTYCSEHLSKNGIPRRLTNRIHRNKRPRLAGV